jgi:hypothetical protein
MTTQLAIAPPRALDPVVVQQVLLKGDLSKLSPEQMINYYGSVCESVGLNPLTKPFEFILLNGKLVLYALRGATDQLRFLHTVAVTVTARETMEGCYIVTARASMPNGRTDESIGAVPIENLKGEARANAMMKAETKAKRRVTLSICGLGLLDETEVETIPTAKPFDVSHMTVEDNRMGSLSKPIQSRYEPGSAKGAITKETIEKAASLMTVTPDLDTPWSDPELVPATPEYPTPEQVMPPPAPGLRVTNVERHEFTSKAGKPMTKWTISLSDGRTATTISKIAAETAIKYGQQERDVDVDITENPKFNSRDLTAIRLAPDPNVPF